MHQLRSLKVSIILVFTAIAGSVSAQSVTMSEVISLSGKDIKATAAHMKTNQWKQHKTVKLAPAELTSAESRYAHFTNCFFMVPEYKQKFKTDPGPAGNGVYRDAYSKGYDSIYVYYYNVDDRQYPLGTLYCTNRVKLHKIADYLVHHKYKQSFTRDSMVTYEIRRTAENVTINKTTGNTVEYYIDRCSKYAGHVVARGKSRKARK